MISSSPATFGSSAIPKGRLCVDASGSPPIGCGDSNLSLTREKTEMKCQNRRRSRGLFFRISRTPGANMGKFGLRPRSTYSPF